MLPEEPLNMVQNLGDTMTFDSKLIATLATLAVDGDRVYSGMDDVRAWATAIVAFALTSEEHTDFLEKLDGTERYRLWEWAQVSHDLDDDDNPVIVYEMGLDDFIKWLGDLSPTACEAFQTMTFIWDEDDDDDDDDDGSDQRSRWYYETFQELIPDGGFYTVEQKAKVQAAVLADIEAEDEGPLPF